VSDGGPDRLWGGRFRGAVDPEIDRFTASFGFDRRLARCDLVGSLAHARMLYERGVLERTEARRVLEGLAGLLARLEAGELAVDGAYEDVHTWIEMQLVAAIGDAGRRLHTARSRNDQTSVALRLYVRESLEELDRGLLELAGGFCRRAAEHRETFLPGYTHLQRGQPTSLAHHLLAHAWTLLADHRRLVRVWELAGVSPLGAGALAGTPHPIDPERTAALLGFAGAFPNSMAAVADRDYVLEAAFACALLMLHLSRFASEIVLWTSSEFGFALLEDSVAKGSSIMPQKRNPEPAEILRGKTARVVGDLTALMVLLKGLPLTYNSDLQEDKEAVFDALDTATAAVRAGAVLLEGVGFRPERMRAALERGHLTATFLADHLVRRGVPFRDAHAQTGAAVRAADERGVQLWELDAAELRRTCPEAETSVLAELRPEDVVRAHRSLGGPAPERVAEQLESIGAELDAARGWLAGRRAPPVHRAFAAGTLLDERLDV
jgi:argininosuccinate lyase